MAFSAEVSRVIFELSVEIVVDFSEIVVFERIGGNEISDWSIEKIGDRLRLLLWTVRGEKLGVNIGCGGKRLKKRFARGATDSSDELLDEELEFVDCECRKL